MNKEQIRLVLAYKNFGAFRGISHIGLGVSAINTSKTLISKGIRVDVWPVRDGNDLRQRLNLSRADSHPVTHVVVSAPWIPSAGISQLQNMFPMVQFVVNCHSNVGFLQADTNGVMLIRQCLDLEMGTANFRMAGNSRKFCRWIEDNYGAPCLYLPNLYFLTDLTNPYRPKWNGGQLRIGCFGAVRPLKNFMSAVAAGMEMARQLKADTYIFMSTGRLEGGGHTVLNSAKAMIAGVPNIQLVPAGWASWPQFRGLVSSMHVLLQPSYTESFNMVTADGVAEGVPTVVSAAIDWAPKGWVAEVDDAVDIARVGRQLALDPYAAKEGLDALRRHNHQGIRAWVGFLTGAIDRTYLEP